MNLKNENIVKVPVLESEDIQHVVIEVKNLASEVGFDVNMQTLIATVASELATNIIRYAEKGEMIVRIDSLAGNHFLEIKAIDKGPGIEDVELALQDNFTTTKNSLGMGLSSLKRIMDEYYIDSNKDEGTTITTRKWKYNAKN